IRPMVAPQGGKSCDCRRTRPCRLASSSACVSDSEPSISATISPAIVRWLSDVCATIRRGPLFLFLSLLLPHAPPQPPVPPPSVDKTGLLEHSPSLLPYA